MQQGLLKFSRVRAASLTLVSLLSAVSPGVVAQAQTSVPTAQGGTAATPTNGEIVVTARSRAESLLDVPIAITALGSEEIGRYNASSLQDLGRIVPTVAISTGSSFGAGSSFNIRGIGTAVQDAGLDQSVLVSIDGVQVARGRVAQQAFFDVEQVAVLKGPQALFFGKNSPAGVISINSAGPGSKLEGFVRAGYEFEARERYVEAAVGGPLSDSFGARLAVRASQMDGWVRNDVASIVSPFTGLVLPGAQNTRRLPGSKDILGRLTLAYDGGGPFTATLKVFGSRRRANADAFLEPVCAPGVTLSWAGVPEPQSDCTLNGVVHINTEDPSIMVGYPKGSDGVPFADTDNVLTTLRMNYKAGAIELQSTTGYYYYLSHYLSYPSGSLGFSAGEVRERFSQFSQELRAVSDLDGPLNFVVGGYYDHFSRPQFHILNLLPLGPDPATGRWMGSRADRKNNGESYSAFAQVLFDVTDQVEFAAGGRYTHETRSTEQFNSYVNPVVAAAFPLFLPQGVVASDKIRHKNFSPEVTATWRPTSDTSVYMSYKHGFKSGGLANPSLLSGNFGVPGALRFGPEKIKGFEIGAKGRFMDRRLAIEFSAYRYNYSDLQLSTYDNTRAAFRINNAASARVQGAELDVSFLATEGLKLRTVVAYNDAAFRSFPGAQCYSGQTAAQGCILDPGVGTTSQDLTSAPLARAPKWSGSVGFDYGRPIGDLKLGFSGDMFFKSKQFLDENHNPVSLQKGYALLNAAIRLGSDSDSWEVALIGQNLANKKYGVNSLDYPFGPPGAVGYSIGRTRQVALQGTFRF